MKSLLDKVKTKLNAQGGFLKAVSVLVGGTAFAQGIAILALPILTRLYTPEEFSLFAIYTSLLLIFSVVSCLRFEIAIPIAEDNNEAIHLVVIALLSNLIISLLIALIIWIFHSDIIFLLRQPNFEGLIWLVPIGVFFSGLYNSLQYWMTRKKNFSLIAKTRMVQSISGSSIQIIMGIVGFSVFGLIIGQIIKVSSGIKSLALGFYKEAYHPIKNLNLNILKQVFKKNNKFPKYSALEALANSAAIQLPIILIAALALDAEAGYLMLAMQIMAIPIGFIGGAVAQVYLAHASEMYNSGELTQYTYKCMLQLIKIGVIPLVVICILAPSIVPFIFGETWQRTGEMMLWMLPWFAMQLLVSPVSMSLHITGRQKVALILQLFGLLVRVGGLYLFSTVMNNLIFEYYALSGFIFYSIYLIIVFLIIKDSDKEFKRVDV
ncbi:oligosaccharide flippase family protein [Acinetobacter sp. 18QD2AZ41W]|uniref:lipopolysaccharide biosynthesis protein n=1 Tax=Acinetobacter sp. 18QD2AZ41W TaxID=2692137 RepID=UPI001359B2FB|nr:oligosaccharide flippase family protein [Acinetobacter sp. 18QD2AZ41W]